MILRPGDRPVYSPESSLETRVPLDQAAPLRSASSDAQDPGSPRSFLRRYARVSSVASQCGCAYAGFIFRF